VSLRHLLQEGAESKVRQAAARHKILKERIEPLMKEHDALISSDEEGQNVENLEEAVAKAVATDAMLLAWRITVSITLPIRSALSLAGTAAAGDLTASGAAAEGGEVMQRVSQTIGQISNASRRIADIIGVIDGLAFQTNFLALAAAVETARAGEQGRGSAALAAEVRSFAQRSAQAAREIKGFIGNRVEKVESGSVQVEKSAAAAESLKQQAERLSSAESVFKLTGVAS
jgi:methyl-accepting chemotaxis protein